MRLLLILAIFFNAAYATGPKYEYKDNPKLDDEIKNIYHDIRSVLAGPTAITGSVTDDSALSGQIGEYTSASVAPTGVALTNNTWENIASISLSGGDWDVSGTVSFYSGVGMTCTYAEGYLSAYSGTTTTDRSRGDNAIQTVPNTTSYDTSVTIPSWRVSASTTTTIYLKAYATFSGGTNSGYGRISARRVR